MIASNNINDTAFVGLFFFIRNKFELFSCTLPEAEKYGDFLNYPYSHMDIWNKKLANIYHVDFDYFPRGRIVLNTKSNTFCVYYDRCIGKKIKEIGEMLKGLKVSYAYDEHYQCHKCNVFYVQ